MKTEQDSIVVYYAPWWDPKTDIDANILYHDPISVYKDLMKNFHPPTQTKNYMQCPAVKNDLESTYLFLNPADTELTLINNEQNMLDTLHTETESTRVPMLIRHAPTIANHFLMEYQISYMFFAEESLEVSMSSPYFHKTEYTNHGAVVPGTYDCGKWFRPLNIEIQLWEGNKYFKIKAGEPLVYFKFNTNKRIIFKKFKVNNDLYNIAASLVGFKGEPRWYSLKTRYDNFAKASMRGVVLTAIKKNLIED